LLLAAAAIVLLHVGVVFYLKHRPADAVTAPVPPPVSVELVQPQIVQPPKPLPQEKQAPPPSLPNPPRTPHIERPPPVAIPATPITPQTPVVQGPPPQQAPIAPSQAPVAAAVGYAGYLNNSAPDYPQFAQDQGWEGHIVLHVHVLPDGHPDTVVVKISSHRKILDEAAQRAVQRWRFSPAKRGENAVDGWVDVPIDFKLST
jgi:protein TonB